MTPQELKNSILQLAIQGKLVEQRSEEGTAEELYQKIQAEKQRLIKAGKIKKEKPLPENVEDENPFDIPENWKWVRVQDLFNVRSAMRIHQTDWRTSGIPFFRGRELVQLVKTGNVDFEIYISRELYEANKAKGGVPQKDDLLISAVGTLGKVYVVQGTKEFYYKDAYILCLENISKIYPQYIKYALESPYNQIEIHKDSMATTVAQLTIIKAKRLLLPLPPLAEQKRIVAKIEKLLPYIDRYKKAWSRLEDFNKRFPDDMKQSIFQLAIQGKLTEQRPEEGTAEELYQKIQVEKQRLIKIGKIKKEKPLLEIAEDEMPFEIPESWKWVSVGNVCINIQYGSSQKSSPTGKIAVLRMGNIQNGRLVLDKLVYTSNDKEIAKYPLQHDDLLFNRTNSKELVGKTAIYKSEIPAIYAGYLVRITPLLINSDYLNYVMQSQFYWIYCQSVRSDAIGQSNINAEKLKRFVFPLPPLAEQKRIVSKLAELLPLCERLK